MTHIVKGNEETAFSVAPESEDEEILQNIRLLLSLKRYELPLAREMGLSSDYRGRPIPVAETLLYQAVLDAIEEFEPRAEVVNIDFEEDSEKGVIFPVVEVKTSDG